MSVGCQQLDLNALQSGWSVTDGVGGLASAVADFIELTPAQAAHADRIGKATSIVAFPKALVSSCDFVKSSFQLCTSENRSLLPFARNGLTLSGDLCECATALHLHRIVDLGRALPVVGAAAGLFSIVTDGADLVDYAREFADAEEASAKAASEKQRNLSNKHSCLSLINLIKTISSIALTVFGLYALFFLSTVAFSWAVISASVIYLVFSLAKLFYSKLVVKN